MRGDLFWVGGYTPSMDGGTAGGIGVAKERPDGSLEFLGLAAEASSPSYLAHGAVDGILYAVDEAGARIEVFRRVGAQSLEHLGGAATSGALPCQLTVSGDRLLVCNYGSGTVDVFALEADGALGERVQTLPGDGADPHAHATLQFGEDILSADLGSDRVYAHRWAGGLLDRTGFATFPAGTGPRDFLALDRVYLLGELDGSLHAIGAGGALEARGAVVADWVEGDHAAALASDASGRHLYAGLRGSDRVAVATSADLGPLTTIPTGGSWPRHLMVHDGVLHVANQLSSTVTSFRIEPTGIPAPIGSEPVPSPTFLLAAGSF